MTVVVTFLAVAAAGYLAWTRWKPARDPLSTTEGSPARFDRFRLQGFEHTTYEGDEPVFTLRADEIVHRKRKIGPLTLNPIKEIVLQGVTIELRRSSRRPRRGTGNDGQASSLSPFLEDMVSRKGLGIVTRLLINRLDVKVFRDDALQFSVTAASASVGLRDRSIHLEGGFQLQAGSGDRLRAREARWAGLEEVFRVAGSYVWFRSGEPIQGINGQFRVQEDGVLVREPTDGS